MRSTCVLLTSGSKHAVICISKVLVSFSLHEDKLHYPSKFSSLPSNCNHIRWISPAIILYSRQYIDIYYAIMLSMLHHELQFCCSILNLYHAEQYIMGIPRTYTISSHYNRPVGERRASSSITLDNLTMARTLKQSHHKQELYHYIRLHNRDTADHPQNLPKLVYI